MKTNVFILLLFLTPAIFFSKLQAQKASAAADFSITIENYYKIKWGHSYEFIDLWKKNHYPLLKKAKDNGDIISIRAEKPVLHSSEETRWDFKVTIVWKNADLGVGKKDPIAAYKTQLYPDTEKLNKEEDYRFSLLLAHWDVITENITPD